MFGLPKLEAIALAVCLGGSSTVVVGQGWQSEPDLQVVTAGHRACVGPMGNIYVVGGVLGPGQPPVQRVEMLSFDNNVGEYAAAWEQVAPLTIGRGRAAVACVNGFVYAIGGWDQTNHLRSVERLDITDPAATWQLLPSSEWLNTGRNSSAAAVDQFGRIYVIGGYTDAGISATVEVYDPARPAIGWTVLGATLNTARIAHGGVTTSDGKIWAIGGQGDSGTHLDSVEIYDPCNPGLGWKSGPSIAGPNSNNDGAILGADGNIYVAGGWLPGRTDRAVRYCFRDEAWQDVYSLAEARSNSAVVLGKNGRVFAIGGDDASRHYANVESLNTVSCYADGDISTGMGVLDIFDFLYFQNKFVAGCPK